MHSDDNECIVANGKMIINVGADNLSGGYNSFHAKFLLAALSSKINVYGFIRLNINGYPIHA